MKVVNVNNPQHRDACLARLCAEVYGREAGIAPLVTFAGTLGVLIEQEAARVIALTDEQSRPVALTLLVLDELGESMEVVLLTALGNERIAKPAERLIAELALKAPLRVTAMDAKQESMFRASGIKHWLDGPQGERIGLGPKHAATGMDDLAKTMHYNERAVLQAFKQDEKLFDAYKTRFVNGLDNFPATL